MIGNLALKKFRKTLDAPKSCFQRNLKDHVEWYHWWLSLILKIYLAGSFTASSCRIRATVLLLPYETKFTCYEALGAGQIGCTWFRSTCFLFSLSPPLSLDLFLSRCLAIMVYFIEQCARSLIVSVRKLNHSQWVLYGNQNDYFLKCVSFIFLGIWWGV